MLDQREGAWIIARLRGSAGTVPLTDIGRVPGSHYSDHLFKVRQGEPGPLQVLFGLRRGATARRDSSKTHHRASSPSGCAGRSGTCSRSTSSRSICSRSICSRSTCSRHHGRTTTLRAAAPVAARSTPRLRGRNGGSAGGCAFRSTFGSASSRSRGDMPSMRACQHDRQSLLRLMWLQLRRACWGIPLGTRSGGGRARSQWLGHRAHGLAGRRQRGWHLSHAGRAGRFRRP
jgi:hypothetical protein